MDNFIEEVILSNDDIKDICERIGQQITKDYEGKTPILVGLLKGSIPFLAELIKHIHCDMEIDFMYVESYQGTRSSGVVTVLKDLSTHVEGRHIILIEDIIDTGLTIREVRNLLENRKAASIEIAALLDNC